MKYKPFEIFYFITIFVVLLSVCLWGYSGSLERANEFLKSQNNLKNNLLYDCQMNLKDRISIANEQSKLTATLEEVGSTPYGAKMNCYDHAKKFTRLLAEKGYQSSIFVNKDRSHSWVAVWFESNSGRMVKTSTNYGPVLEVRDPNLNVICSRTKN